MDIQKIIMAVRDKKQSLTRNGSGSSLTKYLKANGIKRIGITKLTRMINEGELAGKTVPMHQMLFNFTRDEYRLQLEWKTDPQQSHEKELQTT